MVGRAFVLDLIEFVLLHRPAAFQTHSSFKVLLQSKVSLTAHCHALEFRFQCNPHLHNQGQDGTTVLLEK